MLQFDKACSSTVFALYITFAYAGAVTLNRISHCLSIICMAWERNIGGPRPPLTYHSYCSLMATSPGAVIAAYEPDLQ